MMLFLPSAHVCRFDDLARLGAPEKRGIFKSESCWQDILNVLVTHKIAVCDPVPWRLLPALHWALHRDPATGAYVGPAVFFDPATIKSPSVPAGGLAISELVQLYAAATPVARAPIAGRIAVRSYTSVSPLWRHTVPAPLIRDRGQLEAWAMRQRALPSRPKALATWYRNARSLMWRKLALCRLFADLASNQVIAWSGSDQVPASWWQSDVVLDVDTGALYGLSGAKLASGITIYRADERPVVLEPRQEIPRDAEKRQVVVAFVERHRAELQEISGRVAQVTWVNERLIAREPLIREVLTVAFGASPSGPRRVQAVIDAAIAEYRNEIASISTRAEQIDYLLVRLPDHVGRNGIHSRLIQVLGSLPPPGRPRWQAAEAGAASA